MSQDESHTSHYVVMRDGARIAIDVHLPKLAPGTRAPTILRQTRYLRAVEFRWPFRLFFRSWFFDTQATARTHFLANGYAWVDVDVRGSGASSGRWEAPWSQDHIQDAHELVDWIVAQPWSSGQVGGLGISYDGTCAEFLLVRHHPAVKAVAPRFALYDVATDVAFPGGIPLEWFLDHWQRLNGAFDDNRPHDFARWWLPTLLTGHLRRWFPEQRAANAWLSPLGDLAAGLFYLVYRGAKPVDGDADHRQLQSAIAEHVDGFNVHETAQRVTYRDDAPGIGPKPDLRSDDFSPHSFRDEARAAPAAVFSYSGWFDGAYQRSAIARHLTLTNPGNQLLIGPWSHGGALEQDPSLGPGKAPTKTRYDHDRELLRFFDRHLKPQTASSSAPPKPVRYFTLGERAWKEAETWPPPSTPWRYQLGSGRQLTLGTQTTPPPQLHHPEARSSSGNFSRWKSLLGMPVNYSRRDRADRALLSYQSAPLAAELEVTGHPVIQLRVAVDATDAQIFVYLEDVFPEGGASTVTEGQLRCLHRKLGTGPHPLSLPGPHHSFERKDGAPLVPGQAADLSVALLPTSYRFAPGHSIRVAIACADVDNFAVAPAAPLSLTLFGEGSFLELPVVTRDR